MDGRMGIHRHLQNEINKWMINERYDMCVMCGTGVIKHFQKRKNPPFPPPPPASFPPARMPGTPRKGKGKTVKM